MRLLFVLLVLFGLLVVPSVCEEVKERPDQPSDDEFEEVGEINFTQPQTIELH